jgi:hypothetical protein
LVLLLGIAGVVAATVFNASEWSLTIGAPSLWLVLPIGAIWLVAAIVNHRREARP